ncbi:cyclic-phosphate processing receiver domain-containing protein [Heyndrickxia acidicola]|uniref:Cyclic-phosphate processing Receiver domain-containing protein n=1 Tax=Heyndrickxia acidicola TaxID=209389 RepID=A0ABU6MGR1_9BACI|nr:cyclic-phosphate processing receiver domain-containing protein [Heyndrickxia acidicola]MED1203869.1 hypothetical protein [Heyndrickxia acidicola]
MDKISVFLDDYRREPEGYVLVQTMDECIKILQNYEIEHLSLDHDLLSKTRNGYMLVQKMVKQKLFANRITIHSANFVGAKAMYNYLKQAQMNLLMPRSIEVSIRALPLHYFPPGYLQFYKETM